MPARVANCPNCGGQVEFKAGASLLSVCPYCSCAVARVGDDITELEILGKVAPIADLGSPLSIGTSGKYKKRGFTLVGRLQLNYGMGPWNEWYAAFDDGNWGWLAEAQGKVYFTFGKDVPGLPRFSQSKVGAHFTVGKFELTVVERRRAQFVAAEGELPFAVEPGSHFNYCDVQGPGGIFGTIDYGDDDQPDMLFLGEELSYGELFDKSVLKDVAPGEAAGSVGMNCPNCGSGVELQAPGESQRVTCSACDSLLDCSKGNELYLMSSATRKGPDPLIPLGSKGKLDGVRWTIYGHLTRSVTFEGVRYSWEEYLLHGQGRGYRWLTCSDNHWTFVGPAHVGDVQWHPRTTKYKEEAFKHFQSASAVVDTVRGEFYWKVAVGERVGTQDFINPPRILSREMSADEVNWSVGRYVVKAELEEAFKLKKPLPRPIGVAPTQPNPHAKPLNFVLKMAGVFSGLLLLMALLMAVTSDEAVVLDQEIVLKTKTPQGKTTKTPRVNSGDTYLSKTFEVEGNSNMAIRAAANVRNSWLFLDGILINQTTQERRAFGLNISYHAGTMGGDSWSRGARTRTVFLGDISAGQYVIQFVPQWASHNKKPPTRFKIQAKTDIFVGSHAAVFFFLLWLFPLWVAFRYYAFEKMRWAESDHAG